MTNQEAMNIMKPKLSLLRIHHEASVKAKAIMGLAVLGVWIPLIPSIIALLLVKPALREEPVNGSTAFLVKWGRRVSWIFVILNIVGLIALITILVLANDIFADACINVDESYCDLVLFK